MTYEFLDPARDELQEAIDHFEGEREGLGVEFAQEVDRTIEKILESPESWPKLWKDIRWCRTKRFLYAILYFVDGDRIIIVAVMHLRRRPGYWKLRLKDL